MTRYTQARWRGHTKKRTTDSAFMLNVEQFCPYIRAGQFGAYRYESNPGGRLTVVLSPQKIEMEYVLNGIGYRQDAGLVRRSNYNRLYVRCPFCGRCCWRLFLPLGACLFACRLCHNLTHESAQEHNNRLKVFGPFFRYHRKRNRAKITVTPSVECSISDC